MSMISSSVRTGAKDSSSCPVDEQYRLTPVVDTANASRSVL